MWLKKHAKKNKSKKDCKDCEIARQFNPSFKDRDICVRNSNFKSGFRDCKVTILCSFFVTIFFLLLNFYIISVFTAQMIFLSQGVAFF